MKSLFLTLVIAMALTSCSTEPIAMREVNVNNGISLNAKLFFQYNETTGKINTQDEGKNINIIYYKCANTVMVNYVSYDAKVIDNTIVYDTNHIIKFNTGYIYQDGKTRTKFDMYVQGSKIKDVYVYNN